VAAGVARSLLPAEVTAEAIREEIRALREQPTYRDRARQVAQEIHRMPAPDDGLRLLERLAQERSPLIRDAVGR